jgi:hypothetical protein
MDSETELCKLRSSLSKAYNSIQERDLDISELKDKKERAHLEIIAKDLLPASESVEV